MPSNRAFRSSVVGEVASGSRMQRMGDAAEEPSDGWRTDLFQQSPFVAALQTHDVTQTCQRPPDTYALDHQKKASNDAKRLQHLAPNGFQKVKHYRQMK
ncbi:hypothetical protein CDAR_486451 [Caerostris darwini]|uniref:Uncharacterized protein n=1 Tax=Caerostris darwini TaxID=1538125 RepID=A0AAV4TP14_9ARAC|nr:hypothetical protein CDAR_486451 [Caerostris darwini]